MLDWERISGMPPTGPLFGPGAKTNTTQTNTTP